MESTTAAATADAQNHHPNHRGSMDRPQHRGSAMKKSSSRDSETSTLPDSPRLFHSPLRSEFGDPPESPPFSSPAATLDRLPPTDDSRAIVAVDKYTQCSPLPSPLPDAQKPREGANHKPPTLPTPPPLPPPPPPSWGAGNWASKEESAHAAAAGNGGRRGRREEGGGRSTAETTIVRRAKGKAMVKRAGLGFRISEMILCLISFSVMAADKTQGWSGDSFDRYKEYRFCLSVNVIGFAYSGFQLASHLISGKHLRHHLRCHFDFFMDQASHYGVSLDSSIVRSSNPSC
ncbi:hypothetical protein ACJRO7_008460 [Eucalyptus globulus]|uniref:CASP-like protein n=1 Tax=Eucalyptus globulus TaxID=34317 RepID=A0ABD3IRT6_EUCGL